MTTVFEKLGCFVTRKWLFILGGVMWSLVGLMLGRLAYKWLVPLGFKAALPYEVAGVLLALVIFRFGFSKVALKNIRRIYSLREREPWFAFQAPHSYLLILVMMGLGIILRHSPLPKPYLAVLYTGIGGALFLSSFLYYQTGLKLTLRSV